MDLLYPSFLPRVPHEFKQDIDDETWLNQREIEQAERREAFAKVENYPKPIGVKDSVEQSDTVELGEEDELDEGDEDEGELDQEVEEDDDEEGLEAFIHDSSAEYMEEGDSLAHSTSQSDLDMSVG